MKNYNLTILGMLHWILLVALLLMLPVQAYSAPEVFFRGSPDRVLPSMVPPDAEKRSSHTEELKHQHPAAHYSYTWRFKNSKGNPGYVWLAYSVFDELSTRYELGRYTKSNTMAAYLSTTGYLRTSLCPRGKSDPPEYQLQETNIQRQHILTCQGDVTEGIAKGKAPASSYANIYGADQQSKQKFAGHYGNVWFWVEVSNGDDAHNAATIGHAVLSKLSGKGELVEQPTPVAPGSQAEAAAPAVEESRFEVFALPSPAGDAGSRTAYLPASNKLPAKLVAKAKPGGQVSFAIRSGKNANLQSGNVVGQQMNVKAGSNGLAEVLFYYNGGQVSSPLSYEIRVSQPGVQDTLTVNVGLGLAFDRIKAVKGDLRDTYPFTLTVKSRFYPKLQVGNYLTHIKNSGLWSGLTLGVKLDSQWVNMPSDATPDDSFRGTANIASTAEGENLLTVANGQPQYYLTQYAYPAVVMKSDGRHAYRIFGELVLLDTNGADLGGLEESLQQKETIAIVSRDTPEHWMASLVCSLEVTSTEQYVMLETAKMLPIGGEAVDVLTTVTGMMCKFGQAEYESLFYDIGTVLGGKYLDHLMEPEVFDKLTPKQQKAAQLAKKSYDDLDEYKKDQEREKWLSNAPKPPAEETAPTEPPADNKTLPSGEELKDLGKVIEENAGKTLKDIRDSFKGIFKKK